MTSQFVTGFVVILSNKVIHVSIVIDLVVVVVIVVVVTDIVQD